MNLDQSIKPAQTLKSSGSIDATASTPLSPDSWNSPCLSSRGQSSSFQGFLLAGEYSPAVANFSPPLVHLSSNLSRSFKLSIPLEIIDNICEQCNECFSPVTATKALCSLSSVSSQWTISAQRALVRDIALATPRQINALAVKLLAKKPFLGRAARSLTLTVARADVIVGPNHQPNPNTQRAQEQALIGLLPFLPQVQTVRLAATYDLTRTLLDLFTLCLPNVTTFEAASAYGYSRLFYVEDSTILQIAGGWQKLRRISLTMPWVLEGPAQFSNVPSVAPTLSSLEISGYRGTLATLKTLYKSLGQKQLKNLTLDCPIDEEWVVLGKKMDFLTLAEIGAACRASSKIRSSPSKWKSCKEIEKTMNPLKLISALWSWTLAMPVPSLLQTVALSKLKRVTLSAHDCTPETLQLLPKSLEKLTICHHVEYAPLNCDRVEKALIQKLSAKQLPFLKTLVVYDPHGENKQSEGETKHDWAGLAKFGVTFERPQFL